MPTPFAARSFLRWSLQHGVPTLVVGRAARAGDPQARLIVDKAVRADPYPVMTQIRDRGRLYRGPLTYVTASHGVVRDVLRSDDMRVGVPAGGRLQILGKLLARLQDESVKGPLDPPSLLAVDAPDHTRYRTLVSKVFTARAVQRLRERTEEIAAQLLSDLASTPGSGPVDLVAAYATLLPVTVIAEILGVPMTERDRVLRFGAGAAPSLDLGLGFREFFTVETSLREFREWLGEHLQTLRRDPGEDLLSQLVTIEDEGRRLTDDELKATAGLLLAAGFETTVNLIGNGATLLMTHPDELDRLRADPSLWPNAVEEVLRFESPVQVTARHAAVDLTLDGIPVAAGSFVVVQLGGANRDPEVFADPDRFDVARHNAKEHVGFGGGRHFCLGAALARMEGEVGLRALFDRFPDLALAPGAVRRSTRVLRGFERLPVTLGHAVSQGREPATV